MSEYPVGTLVRLRTEIRDLGGELVDPAALSLTVLQSDGTPAGPYALPSDLQTDGEGLFHFDFPLALPGRHIARWLSTTPTAVYEELFDGIAAFAGVGIMSLTEAKDQLNIDDDDHGDDDEIMGFVRGITEVCERHAGAIARRTHAEKHDGGYQLALANTPVLSLTSVVAIRTGGLDQAVDELDLDGPSGVVERLDGAYMYGPLRVTYTAGRTEIPQHVRQAALVILQHLWDTQRGQMGGVRVGGSDEVYDPRFGHSIPRRALELLGDRISGIA